jgi:DNA-binding transcriptional MerR regulator
MPYHRLSTAKIARIVGCHPNTVRIYEQWGFLPPIPRSSNGYRLFEEEHLDQMKLAWMAFHTPFPGRPIRKALIRLVKQAATGDLGEALRMAYENRVLVQSELAQAEAAVDLVEHWASGSPIQQDQKPILIGEVVTKIHVTHDMLRNWERNNMIQVPRHPVSGYRLYGTEEIARARIIRMLRTSGYSTLAILRMLVQLDRGHEIDIRQTLDTPPEDEEILYAADRWLTTLQEMEFRSESIIELLKARLAKLSNC